MQITHSFSLLTQLVESLNYGKWLASVTKKKNSRSKINFFNLRIGRLKATNMLSFFLADNSEGDRKDMKMNVPMAGPCCQVPINEPLFLDNGQLQA